MGKDRYLFGFADKSKAEEACQIAADVFAPARTREYSKAETDKLVSDAKEAIRAALGSDEQSRPKSCQNGDARVSKNKKKWVRHTLQQKSGSVCL